MDDCFLYTFENPAGEQNYRSHRFRASRRLHEFLRQYAWMFVKIALPVPQEGTQTLSRKDTQKIGKAMFTHLRIAQGVRQYWQIPLKQILEKSNIDTQMVNLVETWLLTNIFLEGGEMKIKRYTQNRLNDPYTGNLAAVMIVKREQETGNHGP